MTYEQIQQLRFMSNKAEIIRDMIIKRAHKVAKEAGIDSLALGIHPHNAMVAYSQGKPWKGVDYSKVRLCLKLMKKAHEPSKLVDKWYMRVNTSNKI